MAMEPTPTPHPHAVRIAVIEEQILGLREQQRAHHETAQRRLESLEKKLDELTAIMNRGRGAYAASMALAAGIGAFLMQAIDLVSTFTRAR
jgi:hypothetical protein